MKSWPRWIVPLGLVLILVLANWTIYEKRQVIAEGRPLLLELRPVDPRSIFQGDFMALGLANDAMPDAATMATLPYRGSVILKLDPHGVGKFARMDDGGELAADEMRVLYRRHKEWMSDRLDYGARSFFFQEGMAERYQNARYAVLRVADDGSTVLIDLAGEDRKAIGGK